MNYKATLLILILCCSYRVQAQRDSLGKKLSDEYTYYSIDTLKFRSKKIKLLYTLERKGDMDKKIRNFGDDILNDSVNKISRLYIEEGYENTISIPTIPIDNVIIDDSKKLILCLSRAIASPYKIVLYDFSGNVLFKKSIMPFELEMDSTGYVEFCKSFPRFSQYAIHENQVLFENGLYYVDLGYWNSLSGEEQQKIKSTDWFKYSHYFRYLFPESIDGTSIYQLTKYTNFYSLTDPFYEFETLQSEKPNSIILNDETGNKVKIPMQLLPKK